MTAPENEPQATRRNPRCMAIRRHAQRNHFHFYSRCSQWTFVQNVAAKPISWRAEHWVLGGVALILTALVGIVIPGWANATRHDPAPAAYTTVAIDLPQLPGTEAYRDVDRHPEAVTFDGLLIWRIGGDLFFASIGRIGTTLRAALSERPQTKCVLMDFGSVSFMDISAADELAALIKELQASGLIVAFSRVRDEVRDGMRIPGIETMVGSSRFYERTTDGVNAWLGQDHRAD